MFTLAFLKASAERAVKTFAQALAALLVADGTDLLTTNWGDRLSVAGMAAVVSVLTSVASSAITSEPGPSLVSAEVLSPPADPTPAPEQYAGDSKTDATYHGKHEPDAPNAPDKGGYWGGV